MKSILAKGLILAVAGMFYVASGVMTVAMSNGGDGGGSSGGSSGNGASNSSGPPKCPQGQVWDPNATRLFGRGKCVAEADFNGDDKQGLIYDYGKARADAGDYGHAIEVLKMAPDQSDPKVLNYLGFTHRKLGRLDEALFYYRAAIASDPDFSLVREYLGEAYIQLGLLEKAREQLSEIERICGGRRCGEYRELADLIIDSQIGQ